MDREGAADADKKAVAPVGSGAKILIDGGTANKSAPVGSVGTNQEISGTEKNVIVPVEPGIADHVEVDFAMEPAPVAVDAAGSDKKIISADCIGSTARFKSHCR